MALVREEIEETDATIIKRLLVNSRESFSAVAKECGVSTANISTHFAKLEKMRIIVGSTLQLDYRKLGYKAVCSIFIKCDQSHEEKLLEYIRNMPNIYNAMRGYENSFNVNVVAILRDLTELDQTKDIIKKSSYITDLKAQIWTDIKNYPENICLNSNVKTISSTKSLKDAPVDIDAIDLTLIKELSKNSRTPFNEVATSIKTSVDTVARRYKKLIASGIIKPCIQIDVNKLGYRARAKFSLAFSSKNDTESVIRQLGQIKDGFLIIKASGDFDISFSVLIRDIDQFLWTRREVESITGINRIEANITGVSDMFPSQCQYISTF